MAPHGRSPHLEFPAAPFAVLTKTPFPRADTPRNDTRRNTPVFPFPGRGRRFGPPSRIITSRTADGSVSRIPGETFCAARWWEKWPNVGGVFGSIYRKNGDDHYGGALTYKKNGQWVTIDAEINPRGAKVSAFSASFPTYSTDYRHSLLVQLPPGTDRWVRGDLARHFAQCSPIVPQRSKPAQSGPGRPLFTAHR